MGLFSRHSEDNNRDDEFANVELPTQKDLNESFLSQEDFAPPSAPRVSTRKPEYDIEKAIKLMSTLPEGDAHLVVTVVQQTLESLGVDVCDIIIDAEKKEKRLNDRHLQLKNSIQDLESQIADKNRQIKALLQDLQETTHVKQQLQLTQGSTDKKEASISGNQETSSTQKPAKDDVKLAPKSQAAPDRNHQNHNNGKSAQSTTVPKAPRDKPTH